MNIDDSSLFQFGRERERLTPCKIYDGAGYYSGDTLEFFTVW